MAGIAVAGKAVARLAVAEVARGKLILITTSYI